MRGRWFEIHHGHDEPLGLRLHCLFVVMMSVVLFWILVSAVELPEEFLLGCVRRILKKLIALCPAQLALVIVI